MTRVDDYRQALRALPGAWDDYLRRESGLPGPRGNLELAQAVADEGEARLFERYRALDAGRAPANTPDEFLAFCGVLGLGRLLAQGQASALPKLRAHAGDPRWRVREAVATGLQRLGDVDMAALLRAMKPWSAGTAYEQRAAAAALCEPRLLTRPAQVRQVLRLLDTITASLQKSEERRALDYQALRKGLGYCWSVAVAALPGEGQRAMNRWFTSQDPDIVWVMRENLKKTRLIRMDADWVRRSSARLKAG